MAKNLEHSLHMGIHYILPSLNSLLPLVGDAQVKGKNWKAESTIPPWQWFFGISSQKASFLANCSLPHVSIYGHYFVSGLSKKLMFVATASAMTAIH